VGSGHCAAWAKTRTFTCSYRQENSIVTTINKLSDVTDSVDIVANFMLHQNYQVQLSVLVVSVVVKDWTGAC
jgi:hypothetical protein